MYKKQFWLIKSYWYYLISSKSRYKVHSPFVFNLVEDILKDKTFYKESEAIGLYKKSLSKSKTVIETVDFGKGSGKKNYVTSFEKVGNIVKKRSQRRKQALLLYRLSCHFKPKNILEFGTGAGFSAAYIKTPLPDSRMITMEGCANLADVATHTFEKLKIKNIDILIGDFEASLPKVLKEFDTLDFVFFDGNHRNKATLNYFSQCIELANENSLFVLDDIHWSPGMTEAWETIKKDPRVTLSIDLFWLGFVFFRKGAPKQDFVIRY